MSKLKWLFWRVKNKILGRIRTPKGNRFLDYCLEVLQDENYKPRTYEETMFEDMLQQLDCSRQDAAYYYGTILLTFDDE